jgi:hypothetical protein
MEGPAAPPVAAYELWIASLVVVSAVGGPREAQTGMDARDTLALGVSELQSRLPWWVFFMTSPES